MNNLQRIENLRFEISKLKEANKLLKQNNERLKSLNNSLIQSIQEIKKTAKSAELLTNKDNINLKLDVSSRDLRYKSVFNEK